MWSRAREFDRYVGVFRCSERGALEFADGYALDAERVLNDDLHGNDAFGLDLDALAVEDDDGLVFTQRLEHGLAHEVRHLRLVEALGNLPAVRQRHGQLGWKAAHGIVLQ